MDFKLKKYFIHDVLPPLLYLDKIYINVNHQLHEELLFDLEMVNFNSLEVECFVFSSLGSPLNRKTIPYLFYACSER